MSKNGDQRPLKTEILYFKMRKIYLLFTPFLIIGLMCTSCNEKAESHLVTYEVITDQENFEITYLDGNRNKIEETINVNKWTTSFTGKEGDSVGLFIKSKNLNDKIAAKIIYDGKIIEQVTTYGKLSEEYVTADLSTKLPF
jgi:hypothetical protein